LEAVQTIDDALFDRVAAEARTTSRRRMSYNFHSDAADNPHRFLNVLLRGTYIRPHRHLEPPKAEAFLVLDGVADVIVFTETGTIAARPTAVNDGEWIWHPASGTRSRRFPTEWCVTK
jgi:cupin fold WbuC family metalloprotein